MSENSNEKEVKISLSQFVKIETTLALVSENLEDKINDNKKLQSKANTVLKMLTEIREKHGLSADDGY